MRTGTQNNFRLDKASCLWEPTVAGCFFQLFSTNMPNSETPVGMSESDNLKTDTHKPTILIAEDNACNYRLFETILRKEYTLVHAWNGQEAVELFNQNKPDVILMDINMPILDGYQATALIRTQSPSVPIIAVTAYALASDEYKVMQSGFNGYMSKPINARLLRSRIAEIVSEVYRSN